MANPNIVSVTSIKGKTVGASLGTTSTAYVTNSASSSEVYKVNTIIASNVTASTTYQVNVQLTTSSGTFYIVKALDVPADSSVVVLDKNSNIYLEEGMILKAFASGANGIDLFISYEEIA